MKTFSLETGGDFKEFFAMWNENLRPRILMAVGVAAQKIQTLWCEKLLSDAQHFFRRAPTAFYDAINFLNYHFECSKAGNRPDFHSFDLFSNMLRWFLKKNFQNAFRQMFTLLKSLLRDLNLLYSRYDLACSS